MRFAVRNKNISTSVCNLTLLLWHCNIEQIGLNPGLFFWGGCRGMRTLKHFVNLMGESKNFKMLEFPLNQLQTYYRYLSDLCPLTAFIFSDLNHKMVIFLSQNESTPKLFFRGGKKSTN
jgi:hypothetical protein